MNTPQPIRTPSPEYVLELRELTKTYDGVAALDHVSLRVRRGQVHALVGENGAGKSTLIKLITGSAQPDSGTFLLDGRPFSGITPQQAKQLGIGVIYQENSLVPELSIAENIFLEGGGSGFLFHPRQLEERAGQLLSALGLSMDPHRRSAGLSVAQAQFVAIARVVAQRPKLLILDEPTAPLTNQDAQLLFRQIQALKAQGTTIIYISHRLHEIYRLADYITVLRDGRLAAQGPVSAIPQGELVRLMVGRKLSETYPLRRGHPGEPVLRVRGLSGHGVQNVSFFLRRGEILGLAGLVGSGRTRVLQMLFGASRHRAGDLEVDGRPEAVCSPRQAIRLGLGFVPEDRKGQGVLLERSIRDNISLPILRRLSRFVFLDQRQERETAEKYRTALDIRSRSIRQLVKTLSGGNQQKVAVCKWLASSSHILLLDEPTQGVDVGAKYELYQLMDQLTQQGVSILMASSELEELMGMSDRIIVLHEGRISGVLEDRNQFTQEKIMRLASGLEEGRAAVSS